MIPNKKEQKLREFCIEGNLGQYRNELEIIFNLIEAAGCRISSRTDEHSSQHVFEKDGCRIRISLQKKYENPLDIIWTILHEFGHHLSGKSSVPKFTKEQKIEREILAWKIAEKYIIDQPRLFTEIRGFMEFKKKCLKSYTDNY
ncbi:hypothetical protein [Flavobacterium sp.]|uniref:hypothetical protein n=1 Tax=Flavobacterium sp. TaxID=239 RepID=UPI002617F127|nr:hypothetical protein [Flavobacterium sp.]